MITRANAESILVRRCCNFMAAAGMDVTTTGTNADMNDPLGYAMRQCSIPVSDISNISDDDVSGVSDILLDQFLDIAELRLLENIAGNLDLVDITTGPIKKSLGQLSSKLDEKITRMNNKIQRTYGIGLGTLSAGVFDLNFAEHGDE